MSEFEEIRKLIGQIDPDKNGLATITRMSRVCRYAGVYVEFLRANDETRSGVYCKAVDRILRFMNLQRITPRHIPLTSIFPQLLKTSVISSKITGAETHLLYGGGRSTDSYS